MEQVGAETRAFATLTMLEERLHRLEFLLHGSTDSFGRPNPPPVPATRDDTVSSRLTSLESGLHRLASKHRSVQDILQLHARHPELFAPAADDQRPSTLDGSVTKSIVLAHASAFSETVAGLNSVKDVPIPPASVSAGLLALQPRLERAMAVQESQLGEVAELRTRTARLLERWLDVGVVGQGEVWAEWEERVRRAARSVRRIEVARERSED